MKKKKYKYKPVDINQPYLPNYSMAIDLSKATAVTIAELRKAIKNNRHVQINISIN